MHLVKVDLANCYDTIKTPLLYSILWKRLLSRTDYTVYVYKRRMNVSGRLKVIHYKRVIEPSTECRRRPFSTLVDTYSVSSSLLLKKLEALLFCNVILIGKQHYVQTLGIPQGSILSALLCSFYYGYMDEVILHEFNRKPQLMVRLRRYVVCIIKQKNCISVSYKNAGGSPRI